MHVRLITVIAHNKYSNDNDDDNQWLLSLVITVQENYLNNSTVIYVNSDYLRWIDDGREICNSKHAEIRDSECASLQRVKTEKHWKQSERLIQYHSSTSTHTWNASENFNLNFILKLKL